MMKKIAMPNPPAVMLDFLFRTFVILFLFCTILIIFIFPVRQTLPLNFTTTSIILAHFLFLNHFHLKFLKPLKPSLFALFKTTPISLQLHIYNFHNLSCHIHLVSFLFFSTLRISSLNFIFYNTRNTFFFSLVSPSRLSRPCVSTYILPTSHAQTFKPFIHYKLFFILQNHPT